jgi:hypothetical protein
VNRACQSGGSESESFRVIDIDNTFKSRIFVLSKPFKPSPIFENKAEAYLSGEFESLLLVADASDE